MRCLERLAPLSLNIIFLFVFTVGVANASTQIKLKGEVVLDKKDILIKDIAVVKSDNKRFQKFLNQIFVKTFPENSYEEKIYPEDIKDALKKNYIDISNIYISGNYTVVKRKLEIINQLKIENDVRDYLKKYRNIEILSISVPKVNIKGTGLKKEILERSRTNTHIYMTYKIFKDGNLIKRLTIPVAYKKISYVVFSKTDIRKGEYITKDKVYIKKYTGNTRYLYTDIKELLGKKAKINIKENTPIKKFMVIPDFLVQRGSNVKIIYNRGIIHIELIGRALENGQLNQIIKVKNISSGKVIPCRVIGRNQVLFIGGSL